MFAVSIKEFPLAKIMFVWLENTCHSLFEMNHSLQCKVTFFADHDLHSLQC